MAEIVLLAGETYEKESNNAILACNDWLRLGPGRSIPKLLNSYQQKSVTVGNFAAPSTSYKTLNTWSYKFQWSARAEIFDASYEALVNAERQAEINYGLSLDYERIRKLKRMADLLEDQLYERDSEGNLINLWVADVKQIGSGKDAEQVDIERFNSPLITQLRGVLDDIAKEVGGRIAKSENNTRLSGEVDLKHSIDPEQYNRALESLVDALRMGIPGTGDQRDGEMGTAES